MIYWRTDDGIDGVINNVFVVVVVVVFLYKPSRFHVAVRLFGNRSQITSKCSNEHLSSVFCDLLLNRRTQTWNLFVNRNFWGKRLRLEIRKIHLFIEFSKGYRYSITTRPS